MISACGGRSQSSDVYTSDLSEAGAVDFGDDSGEVEEVSSAVADVDVKIAQGGAPSVMEEGSAGSEEDSDPIEASTGGSVAIASGDAESSGDSISTGGFVSTGGVEIVSTGGSSETGGSKNATDDSIESTGGMPSVSTGGTMSTGGMTSTGGKEVAATGGVQETGGSVSTGGIESTGGSSETGGGEAVEECTPMIMLRSVFHEDGNIFVGSEDVLVAEYEVESDCDTELTELNLGLSTPDVENRESWPFCDGDCQSSSDWFFQDLKIADEEGRVLMGPSELYVYATNVRARFSFIDPLALEAGIARTLRLTLDVRSEVADEVIGLRYAVDYVSSGVHYQNNTLGKYFTLVQSEEVVEACEPFTVVRSGVESEIADGWLAIAPHNDSSTDLVFGGGLQPVLAVDVTARCGDLALDELVFYVNTYGPDDELNQQWVAYLTEGVSSVSYEYNGAFVSHTFGSGSSDSAVVYPTNGATWYFSEADPILINDGETITFTFSLTLNESTPPPTCFYALADRFMTYHSVSNPDAFYPTGIAGSFSSPRSGNFCGEPQDS